MPTSDRRTHREKRPGHEVQRLKVRGFPSRRANFRSTFRNWAAEETNHSREVVEAALAHTVRDGSPSDIRSPLMPTVAWPAMRIFSVDSDGGFTEYERLPFEVEHAESVLEKWLESNPDGILEDGRILIIGRQVRTDLGGFIDLVGLDREGNAVVVELKRDRTPRDVVAQALEYAAFAERLDADALEGIFRVYHSDESLSLADHHRECFGLDEAEAVAFNKDQRIVIIGQRVTPEIRQSASFLGSKGFRITCVEFTFFQTDEGSRLLSQEIVVGKGREKPRQVVSGSLPVISEAEFLASCDVQGASFFSRLFNLAREESMPVH